VPSAASVEVRRHVQKFVQALDGHDYDAARRAAGRCGASSDIRCHDVPIEFDALRLQAMHHDPLELKLALSDMAELGRGQVQQCIDNEGSAREHHSFGVRLPQPVACLRGGARVDLVSGCLLSGSLSASRAAKVEAFRHSEAGHALIQEYAITLLEERVHVVQFSHAGIMSPTFAHFAADVGTARRGCPLFEAFLGLDTTIHVMEAEIPALLYDAGMRLDEVEQHMYANHPQDRERLLDYLHTREGSLPPARRG
jgi:hypothetical protein